MEQQFTQAQKEQIEWVRKSGLSEEQIALYADTKYDWEQMSEIECGLEEGLTKEQIVLYADPKYDPWQMEQIREGLETGLTMDQVKLYAKPEFDYRQMDQIRMGFERNLTEEQIALYAKPIYDDLQMEQLRLGLEHNLTPEQISQYSNPGWGYEEMEIIRIDLELSTIPAVKHRETAEALPVGRLDFLSPSGKVAESIEYIHTEDFLDDIEHGNEYGAPISITLYRGLQGQTIPWNYLKALDPPPQGFSVVDNPYLPSPVRLSVLVVEPEKPPLLVQIEPGLESLQTRVNGDIKVIYPFDDPVAIVCNENGKNDGLAFNRGLYDTKGELYDVLAGTFLVAGLGEEDIASLSPELAAKYMEHFRQPEFFFHIGGGVRAFQGKDSDEAIQKMLDYVNGKAPGWDAPKEPENLPRLPELH